MKILRLIRDGRSIDTEWHDEREPSQTITITSYFETYYDTEKEEYRHRQYDYESSHVEHRGDDLIYTYIFKNGK